MTDAGRAPEPRGDESRGSRLWTIGHSTRSLEELIALLRANDITHVADVRRFPGSRKYPHFNSDTLAAALTGAGIGYTHLPELGGRRTPRPDSRHTGWRNASFRAYADYMDTPDFAAGIARLTELAGRERVANAPSRTGRVAGSRCRHTSRSRPSSPVYAWLRRVRPSGGRV